MDEIRGKHRGIVVGRVRGIIAFIILILLLSTGSQSWWDASYNNRRLIHNLTMVTQLINASNIYSLSDIDNDGTDETIYAYNCSLSNLSIYYNSESDIKGIANGTNSECFWFSTVPYDKGGGISPSLLEGYYPLDNEESVVVGFGDMGTNGTLASASPTQGVGGKVGKAYSFNEDNMEYANLSDHDMCSSNFSIALWVNVSHYNSGYSQNIISNLDSNGDGWTLRINIGANDFHWLTQDANDINSNVVPSLDNWHHVVVTVNKSADDGSIYINGTKRASSASFTSPSCSTAQVSIGRSPRHGRHFNGSIDDVRIYNKTLTQEEITAIYEMGAYLGSQESVPSVQQCQNLSTANEYYKMTGNIDNHATTCFNITNDNIILDCAGYTIDGTAASNQIGVNITQDSDNITVANCTITEFYYGLKLRLSDNSRIENNSMSSTNSDALRNEYSHYAVIDNNTLNGGSGVSDQGLYIVGSDYNNISNNFISGEEGMSMIIGANGNRFYNNTFIGDNEAGITLRASTLAIFVNNSVTSTFEDGIYLNNVDNSIFSNMTSTGADYALYFTNGASNNSFTNSSFFAGAGSEDVYLTAAANINNSFLNCTYDTVDVNAGAELIRLWYVRVNVTNATDPLSGASVVLKNNTNDQTHSDSTDVNGLTKWFEVISYKNISGITLRHTNYTASASASGHDSNSTSFNFSNNIIVNITLYPAAPPLYEIEHRLDWKILCWLNDTHYNESVIMKLGTGSILDVDFGSTATVEASFYDNNLSTENTTEPTWQTLFNFSGINKPVSSVGYTYGVNSTDGTYSVQPRYVMTFYDDTTEIVSACSISGTSSPPSATNASHYCNGTPYNNWFDVKNITLQMRSDDGDRVYMHNVTVYEESSPLGITEIEYLTTGTTQEEVLVYGQTNSTSLWNLTLYGNVGELYDVYMKINETISCIDHFAVTNGTFLYDDDQRDYDDSILVTDFPRRVLRNVTVDTTYRLWHYINLDKCDPNEASYYNWSYEFVPVIRTGW